MGSYRLRKPVVVSTLASIFITDECILLDSVGERQCLVVGKARCLWFWLRTDIFAARLLSFTAAALCA